MTRNEFIEQIAPIVARLAKEYGICVVSPIIAQACLESGYGSSNKAKYNNFFGLKYREGRVSCHSGTFVDGSSEQLADGSYVPITDQWYAFDTIEDGIRGYFQFISISRYRNLIGVVDPYEYLKLIKADGYATSINYVDNVYKTLTSNNLQIYDRLLLDEEVFKMKYNDINKPLVCMQTNSTCYKGTRTMKILGVLFHSTGANNPNLCRYVQPSDGVADYNEMLSILGVNKYHTDWNHIERQAGLNAWIGKLADGSVTTVQTMPWNFRPWGCGKGSRGSCNDGWIQFEICEDNLSDANYFNKVYNEAVELTAYLCKKYGLNPYGNVMVSGVAIPVLTCHADAHKLGFGSGHSDINHWFPKYGKSMQTVRDDVAKLLANSSEDTNSPAPSTPSVPSDNVKWYRVRKSWSDSKSQIGAYKVLDNAIKACKDGYYVFDDSGVVVYPKQTAKPVEPTNELYRVRKSWSDAGSQLGAFSILDNAKKACKSGYSVFDSKGNVVYSAPASTVSKKSVEQLAKEVWQGKWGNGADRRKRLTDAGYDYNAVQTMVNKLYG